jgi:hypothetical protein
LWDGFLGFYAFNFEGEKYISRLLCWRVSNVPEKANQHGSLKKIKEKEIVVALSY